ncbi:MAG: MaoC family dehydratase [Hyphomicrobiales bacterium]|nr:MaoC family dehydratase [Hyphomicrobiales bacterium]
MAAAGYFFEDLTVGMTAQLTHTVRAEDISAFAALSGDDNPVHLDEEYASKTLFKGRIAHGLMTASYISAVVGTRLPGPGCIYVSQTLNFKAPVRIGDVVETRATITDLIPEKRRAILACVCAVAGKTVLEGQAVMMVPARAT